MISINKAVSDLERIEELQRRLAKYYTLAIRSVTEYAIDVEPRHTADFRAHLQMLEAQATFAVSDEEYAAIQSSFRGELRNYSEFASEHMARMRAEMAAATEAMQSFANVVSTNGQELEAKVKEEIARLEAAALCDDLDEIREGIRKAAQGLAESHERLTRSNHLTIAQLQDELRALHQEISQKRRSIYIDAASGAWIRPKLDERVESLFHDSSQPFWVLFVWAGLRRIERRHSKYAVEEVRKALVKRMAAALEGDALVTRWSEEIFAAVIEADPATGEEIREKIAKKLASPFSVQEDGTALTIPLEIRLATVERHTATEEAGFYLKLGEVTGGLSDGPVFRT